jgi:hypothetical protein
MKKEKSLKNYESIGSSQRGKSTNENTMTDDKIKSFKLFKGLSKLESIKDTKKTILLLKYKNGKIKKDKTGKKIENQKSNKITNLKSIISAKKVTKELHRNKTEKKIENSNIKKNEKDITQVPLSEKRNKNETQKNKKKTILKINSIRNKAQFVISKKNNKNNYIQNDFLTIQNTNKNSRIKMLNSVKKCFDFNKKRKYSFEDTKTNIKLSPNKLKIVNNYLTPKIKRNYKHNKEGKFPIFKKNITEERRENTSIQNRFNNNDKFEASKRSIKKNLILRNINNRKKEDLARNKLFFLRNSREKKPYYPNWNNTITRFKNVNMNISNSNFMNTTMEYFTKHNSRNNLSLSKERNSTFNKLIIKRKYESINHEKNILNKKLSNKLSTKNKNVLHNYLKYTISSLNKVTKKTEIKEIKENKCFSKEKRYSKTAEKNIKLSQRKFKEKEKEKTKLILIHRNNNFNKSSIKEKDGNKGLTSKLFNLKKLNLLNSVNNDINIGYKTRNVSMSMSSSVRNSSRSKENNNLKNIDNYIILKELGKGSYASVKLAIHKYNRNKYAIKIYSKKTLLDPEKKGIVNNEIKILKQLDHINIMKLYEVIDTVKYLYLIMEYIDGISLLDTIKKSKDHYFKEQRALKIFIQIVKANIYCQSKNICHRDIKLENILIIKDDIIKLIDFGFAVKADKETYQNLFCGSPSYMAPEIVNKENYIAQYSDIWSLGVLLFSMLYGRFPFKAQTQKELFEKITEAKVKFPNDIEINDKIKILLLKIFVAIPPQRPSLQEILNDISLLIN